MARRLSAEAAITNGSLFALNTNGTGFTNLHSFTALLHVTNSDGNLPKSVLVASGNTLYGTATGGGIYGNGTIFSINLDGTGFTNIYNSSDLDPINFTTNSGGSAPFAGLILSGNTFYGTAEYGGSSGNGTVFALGPGPAGSPPLLAIALADTNALVSWPTSTSGYVLQTAVDLTFGTWSNITSGIGIAGTNFVFTNLVNNAAAFFRLKQ